MSGEMNGNNLSFTESTEDAKSNRTIRKRLFDQSCEVYEWTDEFRCFVAGGTNLLLSIKNLYSLIHSMDEQADTDRIGNASIGYSENSSELTASDDGAGWISFFPGKCSRLVCISYWVRGEREMWHKLKRTCDSFV